MGSIEATLPDQTAIAKAEELLSSLRCHDGSAADQAQIVRQLEQLRCFVHSGFDALMFQAQPYQILPALNVLIEHGVFDAVPLDGGMSIVAIASETKLDATILYRFLRIVLTQAIFTEKKLGVISHTPASAIFRTDQAANFYRLSTTQFPHWWKVSDYLKTHSKEDAYDATKVPYVWAKGKEGKTYYQAMEDDPVAANAWHKGMVMVESMQPVVGMFPFRSMADQVTADAERAFVVDVGGGHGNALIAIMEECGGSFGAKVVLQDMREVLEGENPVCIEGVDVMAHNFYDPQPIKNAHAYFLRNVLHNHYDDRGQVILHHIVDAMGPTSRVLIGEMVLPTTITAGSDPFPYFMDLNMFMEGGMERTEEHWARLLDSVGLEIKRVWRLASNQTQATIEACLKTTPRPL